MTEEANKTRFRIFMWDQTIGYFLRYIWNLEILKAVLFILLSFLIFLDVRLRYIFLILLCLAVIAVYEIIKYYKSGEFMHNYRKYKYPDYKRATKIFKREAELNTEEGK